MTRITVSTGQLASLSGLVRGFVRLLRRLAFVAVGGTVLLFVLLQREGFTTGEAVLTILCLAPPAILLVFARGVQEMLSLPDRLHRLPGEGERRVAELSRLAGQARTTRARGLPLLLWRVRGAFGSVSDVAGVTLPLRVFTPGFLTLTAFAALLCMLVPAVALITLIVVAFSA